MFEYQNGRHPIFNHRMADRFMEHHKHPGSLHAPIVHVKAVIETVEPDVHAYGLLIITC